MLSVQRKELAESKPDESPYPKEFPRWNALDYFQRPSAFRKCRKWVTMAITAAFLAFSAVTLPSALHWTHQAAPVSTAHAMFNQKCANCHTQAFAPLARCFGQAEAVSVKDETCNQCHHGAEHNAKAKQDPSCVTCHREHSGHEVLTSHVASRQCTECHQDLSGHLREGEKTEFNPIITGFNRDHPPFKRSAPGQKDGSKIKFNHKAHLDLAIDELRRANQDAGRDDLKGLGAKLECAQCHQLDDGRRYMLPINYDQHCARCHQLNVALVGTFAKELAPNAVDFSKTPLPHKEPAVVRAVLRDRLVQFTQKHKVTLAKSAPNAMRPLPWKPTPEVSDEQWTWATEKAKIGAELLFVNKQWKKTEALTWCSHCHIEVKDNERVDGLPVYHKTGIPSRWHEHSVFSHGAHRMMGCVECHDRNNAGRKVADSETAADVLLPTLQSCQECHRPSGAARNSCVECHRYHDRSKQRDPNESMTLEEIVHKNR